MKDKTKIYDKKLYKTGQTLNDALVVIIAFLLGFAIGIYSMKLEVDNRDKRIQELESKVEIIEETKEMKGEN